MHTRDTLDVQASVAAIAADACAVFAGFMLATWIRFDSGWIPVFFGAHEDLYHHYALASAVATLLFLFVFRPLQLFVRPQLGSFESRIPRLARACGLGILGAAVLAFAVKNYLPVSTLTLALAWPVVTVLVILERYILFRLELHFTRHSPVLSRTLILGSDEVASRLKKALEKEPGLRTRIVGFLRTDLTPPHPDIPKDMLKGTIDDLPDFVKPGSGGAIDRIILTGSALPHEKIVDIILFAERNLITFNMVPDLFRILTGGMGVQAIDGIPLLGVSRWPLDLFWNRLLKRTEDIIGALVGLLLSAPVILVAAILIRRESRGPVFYVQERCGESGKPFKLYKLRTMRVNAEAETGPVFTVRDDPRATRRGTVLRKLNLDELPQFWNVLKGDMSLVGPRPERPHFVDKFKEDIGRYMWRHVSKPGLTGWAQVNGLRGNTSIGERVKHDLYYLENWSLSFDFKILAKTLFAKENAY